MFRIVLFGFAYFTLATLTVATTRFGGGVAFIWVANALLLAELSICRRRQWPAPIVGCFVASVAATSLFGFGVAAAVPLGLINMLEAVFGALILKRLLPTGARFDSLAAMFAFIFSAGMIAPALTACAGAVVAQVAGQSWATSWMRWFTGHSLGALTFTPILMLLLRGDMTAWTREASWRRIAEGGLTLGAVTATSFLVFSQSKFPLLFLPSLPIIIATFRLGRFGAAASVIILTIVGSSFTLHDTGPIALMRTDLGDRLQFLQFYLAITVLTALPVAADLARRRQLYDALRDSEARYRLLTAKSSDIVMNLDVDGCIRFVSPSVRTLGGYEPDDLVGTNALALVHPEDRERVSQVHRAALRAPETPFMVEYRGCRSDGAATWMETHTQGVCERGGEVSGVVSVVRDITHRKALEQTLATEASTDPLTGLANRRSFERCFENHLAEHSGGTIAAFDIDHFKQVNDRHGHAAGDLVLKRFAALAKGMVREGDVVARLGGEEFAILLRRATPDQALAVCDRLREATQNMAMQIGGATIRITVSGGIAPLSAEQSAEATLAAADAALYSAKRAGRNVLMLAA